MTASEIERMVTGLESEGKLPKGVTASSIKEMSKSLSSYFKKTAVDKITEFTDAAKALLEGALNTEEVEGVTKGEGVSTARGSLFSFLQDNSVANIGDTMNLDFFLRIPKEIALGASQKLVQNWDRERVDEWPALELIRVYDREVPRGSEEDKNGPDNGWDDEDGRWQAACDEAGDDDAAQVFEETGRMVALKSSGVWAALGDGAGGYDDTLGNSFPPFAFNSGMDVDEIGRDEAEELGLLDEDEEAEPADIDFEDLLGLEGRNTGHLATGTRFKGSKPQAGQAAGHRRGFGVGLQAGEWQEEEHPRDNSGKFTTKEGGSSSDETEAVKFDSIHGRPVTSLIKRLAYEGFSKDEIRRVLNSYGIPAKDRTIDLNSMYGRRGERIGEPLTEDQMADLRERSRSDAPRPPEPPPKEPKGDDITKPEPPPQPPKQEPKSDIEESEPPEKEVLGKPVKDATKEEAVEHIMKRARFYAGTSIAQVEEFRQQVSNSLSAYTPQALGRIRDNVEVVKYVPEGRPFDEEFGKRNTGAVAFYRPIRGEVVTTRLGMKDSWTTAHELGHAIDRYRGGWYETSDTFSPGSSIKWYRYSEDPRFIKAWHADKRNNEYLGNTWKYWRTNPQEGLAVSCEEAHMKGFKELQKSCPHMAKLLGDWKILRTDT